MSQSVRIQSHIVTGEKPGPHLLITGGVHGDEFEPMEAIRRLIARIAPGQLRGKLTLVPIVNEPAFSRGHRTAEDQLDLARSCPGDPAGSITQRIAHALTRLVGSADFYIDLHTGGSTMTISPLAGYMLHRDAKVLADQRRMARAFNLPIIWGTNPQLQGRSLSVARDAMVPAIYCEYGGASICDAKGVEAYVQGCLNVMGELGMIERPKPQSRLEYVIEDPRPASGHLQLCNKAPIDGYFESAIELGRRISAGEPLGCVVDVLGKQRLSVPSGESGLVICVRSFPAVKKGDALAVILEIDGKEVTHG